MRSSRRIVTQADELVHLGSFEWHPSRDGYVYVKGKLTLGGEPPRIAKTVEAFLTEGLSGTKISDRPLGDALFHEFSEVPPTLEGALDFAKQYGWLGVAVPFVVEELNRPHRETPVKLGERFSTWRTEILSMYRLVSAWETVQAGKERPQRSVGFKQHVKWVAGETLIYQSLTEHEKFKDVIASSYTRPELLKKLHSLTETDIVRWYLQIAVNEKLAEHGVKVRLLWDRSYEHLGLGMVPTNLAGFLWLQFAQAIEGGTRFRRCEDCPKWFSLGGRSGRADKRFCSGTCKTRAHRQG